MNAMGEINCGFHGADPDTVVPDWRIIKRSHNGSIVSNVSLSGQDIIQNTFSDLNWVPDLNSGKDSKLIIGPINTSDNQSSYQCSIMTELGTTVTSNVGTITVVGKEILKFNASA